MTTVKVPMGAGGGLGGEAYRLALGLGEERDCHGADAGPGDALHRFLARQLLLAAVVTDHEGESLLAKERESLAGKEHTDAGAVSLILFE